ncbi:sugar diacid recognition domain-containing protein [Shewanella waksmanii]|uniref:sugar diacid recognition domain-containing protein n=1 Tax=Shewanella waksmanii TaxID=213783 RepID=UPI000490C8E4|nr:sugar diacid recognition domain-containing protein [Shewanella waksmanii]
MYFLDANIAQQIVDRTIKIIGHNINVMNNQGVILGSGEPARIGSTHEGALLAISQNRTVEIDSGSARSLQGVKPGMNLPLHYKGEIIGVIGITGEPDSLRAYGELLKMTAEMIVEQSNSIELAQWQNRQKEEFILQLIRQKRPDFERLQDWAARLDIDLNLPRVAAVIAIEEDTQQDFADSLLKHLVNLLENPPRGNLVALTSMTELVILKPAFLDGKQWDAEAESQRIDQLLKRLPAEMSTKCKIALGHYFTASKDINRSYQTAKETLRIGSQIEPSQSKHLYEDYSFLVLLAGLKDSWRADQLLAPYQRLLHSDKNQQLDKTLRAYLQHFGDLQTCAQSLYIHRNTLRYRLERIEQLTGINLQSLDGLLRLYVGQNLSQNGT